MKSAAKNAFRLHRRTINRGYDWWWHSLIARNAVTGALKPFFIEYYVLNPGLWNGQIEWGEAGKKPCYAMIKAGSWGHEKAQIHNFFGIPDFYASPVKLHCRMGTNELDENQLKGSVSVSTEESAGHPALMSDAGSMSWDLSVNRELTYDVGYGSSEICNRLNLFSMYWHVQGMRCRYQGVIVFNGQEYIVDTDCPPGYQDKNWGRDYTNPWIWLNCNHFTDNATQLGADASLDVGGGCPVVAGISLKRKILTAFWYNGKLYEFNFSKFWKYSRQKFKATEDSDHIRWEIVSVNRRHILEISFSCPKEYMLWVRYKNPDGLMNHRRLWNGGHASGTVILRRRRSGEVIARLSGKLGGCEYGEY